MCIQVKEEGQTEIQRLNNRLTEAYTELKAKQQEIYKLNDEINLLESNSVRDNADLEELRHDLKMKNNEAIFLREQLEKVKQNSATLDSELSTEKKEKEKAANEL